MAQTATKASRADCEVCSTAPVIPVLTIRHACFADALLKACEADGLPMSRAGTASAAKMLSAPLPQISVCPTGGVGLKNAIDFQRPPIVHGVDQNWTAPDNFVESRAGVEAETRARRGGRLGKPQ